MQVEHIIQLLTAERDRLQKAIDALSGSAKPVEEAAAALDLNTPQAPESVKPASAKAAIMPKRTLSAAGRKAIAEGAKKRWAAVKAAKAPSQPVVKGKRTLTATARKAMADAAKKRWAAIKAGKAPNPFAKKAGKKAS